jgi:hypothetical protein
MMERIKTLVLDSNGAGWKNVFLDTVLRGFLRSDVDETLLPNRLRKFHRLQWLLGQKRYEAQSYLLDWRDTLEQAPQLDTESCNINNLVEYNRHRLAIEQYPLIIILHTATGDDMSLLLKTVHWFEKRRGKLVVFIGNEYDLMGEKFSFLRATGADFVCSQLPIKTASWLYAECLPTQVLALPHALNPNIYYPDANIKRNIDIGFVGAEYPYFLGDIERNTMVRYIQEHCTDFGLSCDINLGTHYKMPRKEWMVYLNTCKGITGAEAGSPYLDRRGQIIGLAKAYVKIHPNATFEELYKLFFRTPDIPYISGKCISSRHFEPVGTKTCMVLLEGSYNDVLKPDEHYISVNKGFTNIEDVIRRFKNKAYRSTMVNHTYEYIMDGHTYMHRVKTLIKAVMG